MDIYEFYLYTSYSANLSYLQVYPFQVQFPCWARGFHTWRNKPPADALRPVNPNNIRHLRITAAAGTKLAVTYFVGTIIVFPT